MSSGAKRYSGEKKKLNMKKVFAVIIALAVIAMVVVGISKLLSGEIGTEEKTVANQYFAVYTNEKWGARSGYDLLVDTSKIGVEGTIQLLKQYVEQKIK